MLTKAQQRYLARINEAGPEGLKFNGRALRPLEALAGAGLIDLVCDMRPQAKGSGIELVWDLTAKKKVN